MFMGLVRFKKLIIVNVTAGFISYYRHLIKNQHLRRWEIFLSLRFCLFVLHLYYFFNLESFLRANSDNFVYANTIF